MIQAMHVGSTIRCDRAEGLPLREGGKPFLTHTHFGLQCTACNRTQHARMHAQFLPAKVVSITLCARMLLCTHHVDAFLV